MGYSVVDKRSGESNIAFLRRVSSYYAGSKWANEEQGIDYHILQMMNGREGAYGVLQATTRATGKAICTGFVVAVETIKGQGHYRFRDESEEPCVAFMPERLLKKLTPVDELPYAAREKHLTRVWRERCAQHWARKAALRPGVVFTVPAPGFAFGPQKQVTTFKVEDPAKRLFIGNPGTAEQFRCQLSLHLVDVMDFTVQQA